MFISRVLEKISKALQVYPLTTVWQPPNSNLFQHAKEFATPEIAMASCGIVLGVHAVSSPADEDMKKLIILEEFELQEGFQTSYDAVKVKMDKDEKEKMKKKKEEKRIQDVKMRMLREAVQDLGLRRDILMTEVGKLEEEKKALEQKIKIKMLQEEKEKTH